MTIAILLTSGMVICLLVRIAVTDIRARIITNCDIALLFAVLCTINLITGKMPNMVLALVVLGTGLLLFMGNLMGGGDVKLLAVMSLAFDWRAYLSFLFLTALIGGFIALAGILFFRQATLRHGVPYGVAIAAAFLLSDTCHAIIFKTGIFS
ncbi:Flp operon protein B (plasmid) [Sodalis praecaptivus]|uniref:Flp operon protein B n=1 Tax=Sodalis praecaptivus TaxID=1239307 RepID=W0I3W6_9GAMM|nr:prepilin peptidase [Sodalis praecaptivus]AHF79113.1 Flp operon protein B [Sodalis praecaptivus]